MLARGVFHIKCVIEQENENYFRALHCAVG